MAHLGGSRTRASVIPADARATLMGSPMPLTLITGPANAAKAGAVLERLRASLSRDPVLVVPTSADERHYARELAGAGLVFGADVTTFPRLIRDVARKAGVRGRPLGRLARGRVVRAAIRDVPLRELAASAGSPGFPDALGDLFAELQRSLAGPARFGAAVRAWREAGTAPPHAAELAALYSAYHRRLEALGAVDEDGLTLLALNGLRDAWDGRPLLLYGFDDLSPAQLDLVETLVRHTDTEVTVAVTYEPGRAAMAGSATTVELLKPLAREHLILEARSEHYAESARGALHQLERGLFEPAPSRVPPNGAVRLLEAGGERAEAELVGASVLELLRDGMAPEDIAVLVRSGAELFAQVFETYAIPVARERRTPFAHTRLGAGLLAFARAALGEGTALDVVTWLRTPGKLADDRADRLEVAIRRAEARTARDARYHWLKLGGEDLVELDTLAAAEGVEAFLAALLAEGEAIWTAPHVRRGAVLEPDAEADARAARELRTAVKELLRLHAQDPALVGEPRDALEALAERRGPGDRERRRRRARRPARRPAGDPRPPLPRAPRLRPAGGRAAAPPAARAVPRRRLARRAGRRLRAGARPPRVHAPARALALLRLRLAAGGGALPELPQLRRGGRPAAAVAVPGRRPRALHRRAVGGTRTGGCWPRSRGSRGRRRRRTSCAARRPPAARRRRPRRSARPPTPRCWRCSPPATASPRAAWRRSRPARSSG